jgi:hypothetical protein
MQDLFPLVVLDKYFMKRQLIAVVFVMGLLLPLGACSSGSETPAASPSEAPSGMKSESPAGVSPSVAPSASSSPSASPKKP